MIGFYNEGFLLVYRAKYLAEQRKNITVIICDVHLCSLKSGHQLCTDLEDCLLALQILRGPRF